VNLFEGGRRILWVILAVTGTVIGVMLWNQTAFVQAAYRVAGPGATPQRLASADCPPEDDPHWTTKPLPGGGEVSLQLCFKQIEAPDGSLGVALPTSQGLRLYPSYQTEVSNHQYAVGDAFQLPPADEKEFAAEYQLRLWKLRGAGLPWFLALGVIYTLAALLGWILRGFLGVPMGRDAREPKAP
jgi:hypothetical protein